MWLYGNDPDQWFKVKSLIGCSDETVPRFKCALRHPPLSTTHSPEHKSFSFNPGQMTTLVMAQHLLSKWLRHGSIIPLVKFNPCSVQPGQMTTLVMAQHLLDKTTTHVVVSHRTTLRIISNTGRYYTSHKPCALGQINIY